MAGQLTRDKDFPAEAANLVAVWGSCANNHPISVVAEAAVQMLIWALHAYGRANDLTRDEAVEFTRSIVEEVPEQVRSQWDRAPLRTDVEVRRG